MRIEALFTINNFNPRPEKAGKAVGPGAADLALSGKVHLAALKPFLGELALAVLDHCYDAAGNLVVDGIETDFKLTKEFEKVRATLSTQVSGQSIDFDLCKFNELKISLDLNRTVQFSARLQTHPTKEQAAELFALMAREVKVIVEEIQETLPLEGGKGKGKGAGAPATH